MTFYEILSILGQYVGLGLIFYGIRSMIKGTEYREQESIRRHDENMDALKELIAQGHESRDALKELIAQGHESRDALRVLIEGQKTLIERTSM
ncbi:MAG: hypothetical protein OXL41_04550 [Nitrospinae bacterium]|nr:hypothetical protein [Nitrospinota bacterium]